MALAHTATAAARPNDPEKRHRLRHAFERVRAALLGDKQPGGLALYPCRHPFNYPQFRPLRWLPIPDPSNGTILSTSPHCLAPDPLPDSDSRLASQSLSGSAKGSWLEAPFCPCLLQNGQAVLSQDRSMQASEGRPESLDSSSSTRRPASSRYRRLISD